METFKSLTIAFLFSGLIAVIIVTSVNLAWGNPMVVDTPVATL